MRNLARQTAKGKVKLKKFYKSEDKSWSMFVSSIGNIFIRVGSIGLLFLINIQFARLLAPEDFGQLSYALAWVQVLALIVQFGLPNGLMRSITLARADHRPHEIRDTIVSALILLLLIWLFCVALGFSWRVTVADERNLGLTLIVPALILVLFISLGPVLAGAMRGMGLLVWSQLPEQILRPALICMALGAWNYYHLPLEVVDALWLQVAMVVPATAVGIILLFKTLPKVTKCIRAKPIDVAKISLPFLFLAVAQGLLQYAPILLLGNLVTAKDLAMFRIAMNVSDAMNMHLLGIAVVIGPKIVELHAKKDWVELQRLVVLAHRSGTIFLVPLIAVFFFSGDTILRFIFGQAYTLANEPLRILLIGRLFYGMIGFAGLVLSMIGHIRTAIWISLAGLSATLALQIYFVPMWGLEGAAWASVLGMLTINAIGILLIYRLSGRDLSALNMPLRKHPIT
jgi:O-antigen/teichoic acid export membrane protein